MGEHWKTWRQSETREKDVEMTRRMMMAMRVVVWRAVIRST